METPVLGFEARCPHLFNTNSRPSSSLPASTLSVRTLTAATVVKSPATVVVVAEAPRTKPHSKSFLTRKSAISEIEQSPDFLSSLHRAGEMESVMRMMKKMDEQAVSPDYNTFHILIKYFIKEKLHLLAYQTLLDMHSKGHRLEEELCSSLIYHLGKIRAHSEAFSVYNMLRYSKRTICKDLHEKILHILIHGKLFKDAYVVVKDNAKVISQPTLKRFCKAFMVSGNINLVNDVLKVLHGSGHKIDQVQFEIAIARYISQPDKKELLLQLLQWMPGQGYVVNSSTRNLILKQSHLFGRQLIAEILSKHHIVSRTMVRSRSEPKFSRDGYANSIMIAALCRSKRFEEAKQLARDSETTYEKCDLVMLNTMLCAYCRAGEMESVMRMMKKMDEQAVSPDYNTFHILIKYFIKEKLHLLAYQTLLDMHSKGHRLEEELCSSLIYHLGKIRAQSEAFSVYNMLRYSKRTICKDLHEKILHILIHGKLLKDAYVVVKDNAKVISQPTLKRFCKAFMVSGNINLVNDVLKVLHGSGHKIDQVQFEIAIARYISQRDKKELLLQLLQWMPGQGYVVDSSTRNLILKQSHLFGRQLIAEILSKHHIVSRTMVRSRSEPTFSRGQRGR
ncbi:hypothetical protein F2Q68_00013202 [Brassica cretica]|uniref:Pentacotripeptide-repeat region of PRORP domain-containing protein n=1 Tax=Brassica cretica TaxID=69181 RepID=A0A8S9HDM6_BRACR|nr:hypothetical protein F2Q68_00013202 [Brassica cretica]